MSHVQVESKPHPIDNKWIKKSITLQLPAELYDKMLKYMEQKGYRTVAEFLRDLIRDTVERGDQ